jgi:hypothetical protein
VHNLDVGHYDLYLFPAVTPIKSFQVALSSAPWNRPKACYFAENNRVVALGNDKGVVRVFDVDSGILIQEMRHDKGVFFILFSRFLSCLGRFRHPGNVGMGMQK